MKRSVLALGIAAPVVLLIVCGCGPKPIAVTTPAPIVDGNTIVLSPQAQLDAGITTVVAEQQERGLRLQAPGVLGVDESRTARVGSVVDGKIVGLMAAVGDRVEAGQTLAEVHSHLLHEARAAYRKALAQQRHAEAQRSYAVQAHERARRLHDADALSLQEVERAWVERLAAQEEVDVSRSEVQRSVETLSHLGLAPEEDRSGEHGSQIPVRSPLAGAVLERHVTEGTAVTPGAPLFTVSDLSVLWALAEVEESKLGFLREGLTVEVRVAAYPGVVFPGKVLFVADSLDPETRRVRVRCEVPNADGRLKPQMYATISFDAGPVRSVVSVPAAAVQQSDGSAVVFVAIAADRFERRVVEAGPEVDGSTEIISGVSAGDRIASTGSFLLKSQMLQDGAPAED